MARRVTRGYQIFTFFNYIIMVMLALVCILPVLHLLVISLSDKVYAEAKMVYLWPKGFTFDAYIQIFTGNTFLRAFWISTKRTVIGTILSVALTLLLAYPMSKPSREFFGRNIYMVLIIITMVFSAGMVPGYLFIKDLNLFDTIWALILPGAVPAYNVILVMNFMRSLPKDIEEAAFVDGSSYFATFLRIVLPISLPVIATVSLFSFVGNWNSWFDGLLYTTKIENYPLQTYLQVLITEKAPQNINEAIIDSAAGGRNLKSAQIFVTMLPLLIVYPFLQKYFVKGIVLGSVKG